MIMIVFAAVGHSLQFFRPPVTSLNAVNRLHGKVHSWLQSAALMKPTTSSSSLSASIITADASRSGSPKIDASKPPYAMNTQQNVYFFLSNWFVTCLIAADVIGVKVFNINVFGREIHHTCGMISFPVTFLLSDIINEYYGPAATKKTVYLGLVMSIFVFGVIHLAQALPYLNKPFNVTPAAFNMIFGSAKVMYVASILAYLIGQLTDIWLYSFIKRITKGRMLWLRASVSTMVSQMLDSFVVSYVAYNIGKTLTGQVSTSSLTALHHSAIFHSILLYAALLYSALLYATPLFILLSKTSLLLNLPTICLSSTMPPICAH